jgi:transposase
MKLNNRKIMLILKLKNEDVSTYQIRKRVGVTMQRINQIWQEYQATGEIPIVGDRLGRPKKPFPDEWHDIVKKSYQRYRLSASLLEPIIKRDYGLHIPHNSIHKIMIEHNLAKSMNKEVIRKKKIRRYERRHSLSLVHIDWHQRPMDGPYVFTVEDDASRALLCLIECDAPTTEYSIDGMNEALQYGPIRQVLSDNGSQFTCNHPGHRDDSIFEQYCKAQGIKHIRTKPKHPQSNGKVEKWFHTYERHRDAFSTKEEFLNWYNHIRPHTALNWSQLETPWQAFERKMRK